MDNKFEVGDISKIIEKTGKKKTKNAKKMTSQSEKQSESINEVPQSKSNKKRNEQEPEETKSFQTPETKSIKKRKAEQKQAKSIPFTETKSNKKRKETEQEQTNSAQESEQNVSKNKNKKQRTTKKINNDIKESSPKVKNPTAQKDEIKNKTNPNENEEAFLEKQTRTVFVGNLPANFHLKTLKKTLQEYGKVNSIRIRCVAPGKVTLSKKAALLSKQINSNKKTVNAYVVFRDIESVDKVLELNGTTFEGNHIQVDKIDAKPYYDNSLSLFIGNLSFKTTDEELREFFKDCGEIKSVRLIRDSKTGIGKGFGYVNFTSNDSLVLALEKNGQTFKDREIRIKAYKYNPQNESSNKKLVSPKGKKGKKFEKPTKPPVAKSAVSSENPKDKNDSVKKSPIKKTKPNVEFKGEVAIKKKLTKKTLKNRIKSSNVKKQKKKISEILSK